MLPREELEPAYDEAVWLYVFRDFSKNEGDLAAERTCIRFGFTSYPQHWLIHPETLERMGSTGRSVESFLAAVKKARVGKIRSTASAGAIAAAEERAAQLEEKPSVKAALAALDDNDIVVRYRAVEILAEEEPGALSSAAEELLAIPNDPLRYLVCAAIAESPTPGVARHLDAVVAEPKESLNPNVLRINAVKALAACGDAESVAAIAPHAATGAWRNGLTKIAIDALAWIAERHKMARTPVKEALVQSYPPPPGDDEREQRGVLALAKHVHDALRDLTGKRVKFPERYDESTRRKLVAAW